MSLVSSIVLVHGGFVDGSGWEAVYQTLSKEGHEVIVVQNATKSLEDDVTTTKDAIASAKHDVVLVGHSYGGAVITEAGNDPKVKALAYITAFALDDGESVGSVLSKPEPGYAAPPILPPVNGYFFLDRSQFAAFFAFDVQPEQAEFMAASQVPWGVGAINGAVKTAAWRSKPAFYLLVTEDRMIPPPSQRKMAIRANASVMEVPGSHAIYISNPTATAALIRKAAEVI